MAPAAAQGLVFAGGLDLAGHPAHSKAVRLLPGLCGVNPPARGGKALGTHSFTRLSPWVPGCSSGWEGVGGVGSRRPRRVAAALVYFPSTLSFLLNLEAMTGFAFHQV